MREIVNHGSKLSPSRGEVLDLWSAEEFVECRSPAAGFLPESSENLTKREFGVFHEALSNLGDCPREVPMRLLNQRCCDRVHESAAQQTRLYNAKHSILADLANEQQRKDRRTIPGTASSLSGARRQGHGRPRAVSADHQGGMR